MRKFSESLPTPNRRHEELVGGPYHALTSGYGRWSMRSGVAILTSPLPRRHRLSSAPGQAAARPRAERRDRLRAFASRTATSTCIGCGPTARGSGASRERRCVRAVSEVVAGREADRVRQQSNEPSQASFVRALRPPLVCAPPSDERLVDRRPDLVVPDGARIAFVSNRGSGRFGLWVMNANGTGIRRLANDAAVPGGHRTAGRSRSCAPPGRPTRSG